MSTSAARGFALCTAAMLILGTSVPLNRILLDYPPALGQALRYSIAAAAFGTVILLGRRPLPFLGPHHWWRLTAIAGCLVAFNLMLHKALWHADPTIVATVLGCAPLGMAVCVPLLRGQAPTVKLAAAATIVAIGTALIHGSGTTDLIGLSCAFGALTAEIGFSYLAAGMLTELGPVLVAAGSSAIAVPIFGFVAFITGETGRWRNPTATEGAVIVFLGLILTALAFTLWFHGIQGVGVDRAAITISCIPLTAVVTTALNDGTLPAIGEVTGIGLVMLGFTIGLGQGRDRRSRSSLACPMCPSGFHYPIALPAPMQWSAESPSTH